MKKNNIQYDKKKYYIYTTNYKFWFFVMVIITLIFEGILIAGLLEWI